MFIVEVYPWLAIAPTAIAGTFDNSYPLCFTMSVAALGLCQEKEAAGGTHTIAGQVLNRMKIELNKAKWTNVSYHQLKSLIN